MNGQADHVKEDLTGARQVILEEAEALKQLADGLTPEFSKAVEVILQTEGRVVVSGMGKSGHIGRKVAATFASTGTPAQFVHPAEASHGDLGMLTKGDAALVFSNSGETPELADLVSHVCRFGIPLIAAAAVADSTLLRAADIALLLPAVKEACVIGMAPTTSTTATLALGDALAMTVMRRRSFAPEHFRMLHPGGRLGAQLLSVRDLMHVGDAVPLVPEPESMQEALLLMSAKGFGITGVVDSDGMLIGVISDGDIRRNMEGLLERRAGDVATRDPKVIEPQTLAVEAVRLMHDRKVLCLFVVEASEGGMRPVGLLHIRDGLRVGIA